MCVQCRIVRRGRLNWAEPSMRVSRVTPTTHHPPPTTHHLPRPRLNTRDSRIPPPHPCTRNRRQSTVDACTSGLTAITNVVEHSLATGCAPGDAAEFANQKCNVYKASDVAAGTCGSAEKAVSPLPLTNGDCVKVQCAPACCAMASPPRWRRDSHDLALARGHTGGRQRSRAGAAELGAGEHVR